MKFSVIAVVGAVALVLAACSRSESGGAKTAPAEKPRAVRVVRVEARPMERVVTVAGSLAAHEQAVLSVKVPGRVESLAVDLGSVVKRGALIAQIDRRDYELQLQQAAAALAKARAAVGLSLEGDNDRFEPTNTSVLREAKAVLDEATQNRTRVRSLSKSGISSQAELDMVEGAYNVALSRFESAGEEVQRRRADLVQRRVEHDIARQQLADTAIVAPFDGAVQVRTANVGEYLAIADPVATLMRIDPLRLRLEIPEREALGVKAGQPVRVRVEGSERVYTGTLSRLSPGLSETSRVLMAEADIPNEGSLRPGLFARAEIVVRQSDSGLAVPPAALIVFAGLEKVVVVKAGRALEQTVATGRRGENWVEIVSGLSDGDTVVLEPGNLRTGQPVQVPAPSGTPVSEVGPGAP